MPRANPTAGIPRGLKAFSFLGVEFSEGDQPSAQCPFCGDERGKFRVNEQSGLWDCKHCGKAGNPLTFIRELWTAARDQGPASDWLAALAGERRLLPDTLLAWGVVESPINGDALVPGFAPDGKLWQLYRYTYGANGKRILMCCPAIHPDGSAHGLFAPVNFTRRLKDSETITFCEGPWDGMAAWEVPTKDARQLIVATPGCKVFSDRWLPLVSGRHVQFIYDNDAPREFPPQSGKFSCAGYAGMLRAAHLCRPKALSTSGVVWGVDGFDRNLPDGYDLRDALNVEDKDAALQAVLSKVVSLDSSSATGEVRERRPTGGGKDIESVECSRWSELLKAWRKALYWLPDLEDMLATMLAVSVSTLRVGDQLFLQVIADAGSAKTRFCDALLVSKRNFPLEHLTSFHSGWKDASGEDFSLIARINGKCMITPEGDVLMSNPRFAELMSQQRRIFDGTTGSTYGNRKEDTRYTGLRTPWIMAGTPALLDTDQSRLGDRFLRIRMRPPNAKARKSILERVGYAAIDSVMLESNCSAASQVEGRMLEAYQLTGGYCDWLWDNINTLLAGMQFDRAALVDECAIMGELVADLRARPNEDARKKETHDTKELPSRLTAQFTRLALCLAAVMNKPDPDDEVIRRVRRVAADTAAGRTWEIVRSLATPLRAAGVRPGDPVPLTSEAIAVRIGEPASKVRSLLQFLRKIDCVTQVAPVVAVRGTSPMLGRTPRWAITPRIAELWRRFHSPQGDSRTE